MALNLDTYTCMLHAHVYLFIKPTAVLVQLVYIHVYIHCTNKHGLHHVLDIAKLIYKTCFVIIINVTFLMDNPFLIQSSERLSPYRRLKTKTSMLV